MVAQAIPNPSIWHESLLVRGCDTDLHGRWKPQAAFQVLTEAAGQHASALGWGFFQLQDKGQTWVLSRMKVHFLRYPTLSQRIHLTTWPKGVQQKIFFTRDFEMRDDDGNLLIAATSAWLVIDTHLRRFVLPQVAALNLPDLPNQHALDEPMQKINPPEAMPVQFTASAGYSSVDVVGHVNNSRYVEWICDCFPIERYRNQQIEWLQVNYLSEIQPSQPTTLSAAVVNGDPRSWLVLGAHSGNATRTFEAALRWRDNQEGPSF